MELSASITEPWAGPILSSTVWKCVLGLVHAGGRAWRLILRLRGTARFEIVLEFCTLVHNFASRSDAGSASRASALSAYQH